MSRSLVEDAYPLSPMQEGMLFHTLYAPRSGVDIEQVVGELGEHLDAARFRAAWERVVAARPVLRTAFRWEGLDAPLQEVHHAVDVPWHEEDLRPLPPAEQEARLQAFLMADRAQGFDPARAPLLRVALFRTGEAASRLVWTFHHILLDGRSFPLVLGDVFASYEAPAAALPARRPYRDFIAWLTARDARASEPFWREALRGFTAPTPLLGERSEGRGTDIDYAQLIRRLPAAETATLVAFGARHGITLNTLAQGAWSILLSRYAGESDVVFGATRACRRTALGGEGTDAMVGLLINTLPLRVAGPAGRGGAPWLHEIQARGRALRDHEHTPLVQVRAWSELPPGAPLFETLLVFDSDGTLRAVSAEPGRSLRGEGAPFASFATPTSPWRWWPSAGASCGWRSSTTAAASTWRPSSACSVTSPWSSPASSPIPGGPSATCRSSRPPSAARSIGWNRHGRRLLRRRARRSTRSSRRRSIALRAPSRSSPARSGSPTASSTTARTASRTTSASAASGPTRWWASASSARSRCSSACSASSRRAAPTCRSTPIIHASASPSSWPTPARPSW